MGDNDHGRLVASANNIAILAPETRLPPWAVPLGLKSAPPSASAAEGAVVPLACAGSSAALARRALWARLRAPCAIPLRGCLGAARSGGTDWTTSMPATDDRSAARGDPWKLLRWADDLVQIDSVTTLRCGASYRHPSGPWYRARYTVPRRSMPPKGRLDCLICTSRRLSYEDQPKSPTRGFANPKCPVLGPIGGYRWPLVTIYVPL